MTARLPNELLIKIIKDVALSQTDLLRLRSADRKLRYLATPHAFRVLDVGYTPKSAKGLENLLDSQAVAQYVEEILCEDTDEDTRKFKYEPDSDDEVIFTAYSNALSALHRFPNLHSLSFDFFVVHLDEDEWEMGPASAYQQFQRTVLEALSRSPRPHPSFKSLTIEGILPHIHAVYADPAFTAFIGSLHHLRWFVLVDGDDGIYEHALVFQDYWNTVSTRVLRPAVLLRSLSLGAGDIVGGMPSVDLGPVHCPHLESISLTNVQFDPDDRVHGTEDFIMRHKDTLTKLELNRCAIEDVEDGFSVPIWADVWDRFARELGKLRELKVRFDEPELDHSERDDPQMRYIVYDVYQYVPLDRDLDGEERDRPALEALEELVRTRAEAGNGHDVGKLGDK
ncbi:hypothetical protein OF83DRAFT_535110 [Amylostereum chailletii]|nr:hypothetical protein OF83DRAFT_535110 [Amylostereum chailletii]